MAVCKGAGIRVYVYYVVPLLLIAPLLLVQNYLFTFLLSMGVYASKGTLMNLIFINNSLANFILFITFFLLLYWIIPGITRSCRSGLAVMEANFIRNNIKLLIVFAVVLLSISSIARTVVIMTGGLDVVVLVEVISQLVFMKHTYFELGGYLVGSLSVLQASMARVFGMHGFSYLMLFVASWFEVSVL